MQSAGVGQASGVGAAVHVDIYQPYLGEEQRRRLPSFVIPHDLTGNTANHQREYELFRRIAASRPAGSGAWGLLSSKFELKTMIRVEEFAEFARHFLDQGASCAFINPMIGNAAIHLNVWEQWWVANDKVSEACRFLETVAPIHSKTLMGNATFAFCNYFVGTEAFWQGYFAYVEQFAAALEQELAAGSDVGTFYGSGGCYARNMEITARPFIIERLFSSYLSTHPEIPRAAFPAPLELYQAKFGTRLGEVLHHIAAVKEQAAIHQDHAIMTEWAALRTEIFGAAMNIIWPLDDPLDQMMSPRFRPSLAAA